jgi:hypothetical protein
MKKFIIAALPMLLLGACTKDLTSLNTNPKGFQTVPGGALFTQAQNTLASTLASSNVYLNTFRLFEQQWQETTYVTESNYDIKNNKIPDGIWTAYYRDVLEPFEQAKVKYPTTILNAGTVKNDVAITDIMEVYTYYYLVTTFGNIPYTQALNIDNKFPKYDDAATVYAALITRLDADVAQLDPAQGSLDGADQVYGGSIAKWKLFANTFKLKMGITLADADNAKAKTVVSEAVTAGVFTSNDNNANFAFASTPPNTNPVWVDLVQSGRLDFIAAVTIVNNLSATSDPRLPLFFTTDESGGYSGGILGAKNSYDAFSKPSTTLTAPDFPGLLLDYAETEFNLAEAVERGYITGSAADHYAKAITASIEYWGGTSAQATTYLALPSVAYATATGNYKQKIGYQKWVALYNRGWDAWIENRRLDYPKLPKPAKPVSDFPVRLTYPVSEQNVNTVNYDNASSAIGGDDVTTKLFFDKN